MPYFSINSSKVAVWTVGVLSHWVLYFVLNKSVFSYTRGPFGIVNLYVKPNSSKLASLSNPNNSFHSVSVFSSPWVKL